MFAHPERRARYLHRLPTHDHRAEKSPMPKLLRLQMFRRFAQRKTGNMRRLGGLRDPTFIVPPAPVRHQRVQRVPVRHAVLLRRKPSLPAPGWRAHSFQPRRPLPVFARRYRGITVAGWQNTDRRAVTVRDPLAGPTGARLTGPRQLGDRDRGKRLVDRDIDDRTVLQECRVHPGARRRQAAEESGLLANRAHRRFVQVVHLSRQHAGDAAGKVQRQVGGGFLGARPGLAVGGDQDQRRFRIGEPQHVRIATGSPKRQRAALADDQIGGRYCVIAVRATVQMFGEWRGTVGADPGHAGAHIGEQPAAYRGGEAGTDLQHTKPVQHRHRHIPRHSVKRCTETARFTNPWMARLRVP